MISTNQFRNGSAIRVDGKRFTILFFQHVKPGKGGAFVRTRLRNIDSGAVVEKTFRAGEKLENVRTESRQMTYLYRDGDLLYVMDSDTYEQVPVPTEVVGAADVDAVVRQSEARQIVGGGKRDPSTVRRVLRKSLVVAMSQLRQIVAVNIHSPDIETSLAVGSEYDVTPVGRNRWITVDIGVEC